MRVWNALGAACPSLTAALSLPEGAVTLVGGGGKSTLLHALAWEWVQAGETAALTSTTHIRPHPRLPVLPRLREPLSSACPAAVVGALSPEGRLTLDQPFASLLPLAGRVVNEGDGSRGLPCKAPADHEPVIPPESGTVIAVFGLSALGRPIARACHRPERVCALLGRPPEHRLTPGDLALLAAHPLGLHKGLPPGAAFRCVLNQGDTPELRQLGLEAARTLTEEGVLCVLTQFDEEERGGLCWF